MGLLVGGYILEVSQAREWANKRFPDIKWSSSPYVIHADIRNHLKLHYKDPVEIERCSIIYWKEATEGDKDTGIFFPVAWKFDSRATREKKHGRFRECEKALAIKKELFEPVEEDLPYLKDIRFVTVCDPQET
ncbi:hypothetical protein BDN67DRAFT_970182 [Paxillus ammoniavirescens]|nr:hypothetical protein BDN67DRAFT_970182 [Paxillus ammoniavirescens]